MGYATRKSRTEGQVRAVKHKGPGAATIYPNDLMGLVGRALVGRWEHLNFASSSAFKLGSCSDVSFSPCFPTGRREANLRDISEPKC